MNDDVFTTLQDALATVIGEYEPIEKTYEVTRSEVVVIADTPEVVTYSDSVTDYLFNWSWFGGLMVFSLFLYCFLRAVGGMLKCKI